MAWLEQKQSGSYHIVFRLGKQKLRRSLKTKNAREATARRSRIEENLRLVNSGRLSIPEDADIVSFLPSDGKLNHPVNVPKRIALRKLYEKYVECLPAGSIEENSLSTAEIHMRHVCNTLGHQFQLRNVTTEHLQTYVYRRALQPGRFGKSLSSTTIRKELSTFRTIWNWAVTHDYVSKPLSLRNPKYPSLRHASHSCRRRGAASVVA